VAVASPAFTASASFAAKVLAVVGVVPFVAVTADAAAACWVCIETKRLWISAIRAVTPAIPFNDSYLRARRRWTSV
jgi:hypothetical protein